MQSGGWVSDVPDAVAVGQNAMVDEIDLLRVHVYDLLATLLGRAPTREVLAQLAAFEGDGSAIGQAIATLRRAAGEIDAARLEREHFHVFVGVGRGELLPYASYYLTGFLNERPLARVREDLRILGVERDEATCEPEDHIAILFEVMAGLAARRFPAEPGAERAFFERNLKPWAERFFADLETAPSARFYRAVGGLGRLFMEIETEAFAMEG